MHEISFVIWREGAFFVAQCLNVEVSSFGETIDEARANLTEAVELYFEGETLEMPEVSEIVVGKTLVNT
jgi:predicted RNase H-like HicB family nuclease